MSDPFKFRNIAFAGREFEGPYSKEIIRSLTEGLQGTVVDVGCGKGYVLKATGLTGVGIDINPSAIEIARQNNPSSTFYVGDAKEFLETLDRSPDLIINVGASQAIGTSAEALAYFASALESGKHLLFGDGVWDEEPSNEYLDFLGAKREELPTFEQLLDAAAALGLQEVRSYRSTQEDWDSFEDHYYHTMIHWCDDHGNDPDEPVFRERMQLWRKNYLEHGRGVLGFALFLFDKVQ